MDQQLILDRYRPLAELGEGGFGEVVLAWDTRMQRRVAVKRLALPLDSRGTVVRNPPGLAEGRTAAMLNHPSIVTVYDFETDADEAFLIMEYVDGASLERVLEDLGGPLDVDETAAVVGAVADALEFAHANGVLHLDVKPANVLIARDGRIKVADFGMAALSSATGHTSSGGGTIGYMPLEQLEGQRVGESTDEWALASLTYEALTGVNPFDEQTLETAIVRLETLDPPAPSSYAIGLPPAVDDVLLAALGPRPADRYPTVAAFAGALLPHLGDAETGAASLGELVEAYAAEEPADEAAATERIGLWDRTRGAGALVLRGVAAAESGWLAWAGLAPLRFAPLAIAGAVALVALAGALAPSLGTGLGLLAFAIGLWATRLWLLAALFSLGSVAWWWFVARRSAVASVLPLSAPVLAIARVPYVMPLLAGFALPPLEAALAALLGGVLTVLASAATAGHPPYAAVNPRVLLDPLHPFVVHASVSGAFLRPSTWIALAGWPVAAAVMSLFCRRASRGWAMLGSLVGTGVIWGAHALARQASVALGTPAAWTGTSFGVSLALSLILVLVVAALGAPLRAEEEGAVAPPRGAPSDREWDEDRRQ